jgi:hypothetical protein
VVILLIGILVPGITSFWLSLKKETSLKLGVLLDPTKSLPKIETTFSVVGKILSTF